jgi:hypothetical protein
MMDTLNCTFQIAKRREYKRNGLDELVVDGVVVNGNNHHLNN